MWSEKEFLKVKFQICDSLIIFVDVQKCKKVPKFYVQILYVNYQRCKKSIVKCEKLLLLWYLYKIT
jgi:hypothetical protein